MGLGCLGNRGLGLGLHNGGNRSRRHGVEWCGEFYIIVVVNIEIIFFRNVLGAIAGKDFHLAGGFNCGIVGLRYIDCGHLVVAIGEEGPGLQVLEVVDPCVDIITGDRMGPGPT